MWTVRQLLLFVELMHIYGRIVPSWSTNCADMAAPERFPNMRDVWQMWRRGFLHVQHAQTNILTNASLTILYVEHEAPFQTIKQNINIAIIIRIMAPTQRLKVNGCTLCVLLTIISEPNPCWGGTQAAFILLQWDCWLVFYLSDDLKPSGLLCTSSSVPPAPYWLSLESTARGKTGIPSWTRRPPSGNEASSNCFWMLPRFSLQ